VHRGDDGFPCSSHSCGHQLPLRAVFLSSGPAVKPHVWVAFCHHNDCVLRDVSAVRGAFVEVQAAVRCALRAARGVSVVSSSLVLHVASAHVLLLAAGFGHEPRAGPGRWTVATGLDDGGGPPVLRPSEAVVEAGGTAREVEAVGTAREAEAVGCHAFEASAGTLTARSAAGRTALADVVGVVDGHPVVGTATGCRGAFVRGVGALLLPSRLAESAAAEPDLGHGAAAPTAGDVAEAAEAAGATGGQTGGPGRDCSVPEACTLAGRRTEGPGVHRTTTP
jgi:hypothetical protein